MLKIIPFICMIVLLPIGVFAQTGGDSVTARVGDVNLRTTGQLFGVTGRGFVAVTLRPQQGPTRDPTRATRLDIRRSLTALDDGEASVSYGKPASGSQASSGRRQRSTVRKVIGGIVGAVGGLVAGGYLGIKIEGNSCRCDDPGLLGLFIGAPIGALLGGFLGAMFF